MSKSNAELMRDVAYSAIKRQWQDIALTRYGTINLSAIDRWFAGCETVRKCYDSNITAQGAQWDNRRGKVS